MEILQSIEEFVPKSHYLAVVLGNFDGLHLGHRELIAQAKQAAAEHNGELLLLTFFPHPMSVVGGEAPALLCSQAEKRRLIAESGVDCLLELPFTEELAALRPDDFVQKILYERLGANLLAVGFNFHFGANGRGSAHSLKSLGELFDMQTLILPPYEMDGEPVSSSRIRELLAEGRMREANRMLGREFTFDGVVEHGRALGRKLGFPTANMAVGEGLCLPAYGVYAARASVGDTEFAAVVNIGVRPTVGEFTEPTVEAHLLDVEGVDLYGRNMHLGFVAEIRAERRFDGMAELTAQIAADKESARKILL